MANLKVSGGKILAKKYRYTFGRKKNTLSYATTEVLQKAPVREIDKHNPLSHSKLKKWAKTLIRVSRQYLKSAVKLPENRFIDEETIAHVYLISKLAGALLTTDDVSAVANDTHDNLNSNSLVSVSVSDIVDGRIIGNDDSAAQSFINNDMNRELHNLLAIYFNKITKLIKKEDFDTSDSLEKDDITFIKEYNYRNFQPGLILYE